MHYRSCQSPHIPLEDCLIYNPVSAKAKTTIYSVFPLLASAIALTHPFLDGAFLAISLFPEYHPDALILFQSVKLASIKPKNPLLILLNNSYAIPKCAICICNSYFFILYFYINCSNGAVASKLINGNNSCIFNWLICSYKNKCCSNFYIKSIRFS